jgi:hypothetical protein
MSTVLRSLAITTRERDQSGRAIVYYCESTVVESDENWSKMMQCVRQNNAGRCALIWLESSQKEIGNFRQCDLMSHKERPQLPESSMLMRQCRLQLRNSRRSRVCISWGRSSTVGVDRPHVVLLSHKTAPNFGPQM